MIRRIEELTGGILERVRRGDRLSPTLAAVLSAASLGQRAGMWWRLRGKRTRVEARVISFGNLTAGGTGKTPAVIARAAAEVEAGRRVAVVTRGYGSVRVAEPWVVAPGEAPADLARRMGDEPALIARRVPGVMLVKSADRVAGARAAIARGCDTILLDDGYQAVALERDENILLIDASNPFGIGRLTPRGILREPLAAMSRATEIVLTRCDQAGNLEACIATVRRWNPDAPLRLTRHAPERLWRVCDGAESPLEGLRGEHVNLACGIARPEAFVQTVESLGAIVHSLVAVRDHGALSLASIPGSGRVLVTEKDAVRLGTADERVYALGIALTPFKS